MRDVYTQRLLDIDHARRRRRYGHAARVTQLRVVTALSLAAYALCRWLQWRYPARRSSSASPPSFVVIDRVRVEVVADDKDDSDWRDGVRVVLGWCSVLCSIALLVYDVVVTRLTRADAAAVRRRHVYAGRLSGNSDGGGVARDTTRHSTAPRSSIAVAATAAHRHLRRAATATSMCGGDGRGKLDDNDNDDATRLTLRQRLARLPGRTRAASLHTLGDLDAFLHHERSRQQTMTTTTQQQQDDEQQAGVTSPSASTFAWTSRLRMQPLSSVLAAVTTRCAAGGTSRAAGGAVGVMDGQGMVQVYYDTPTTTTAAATVVGAAVAASARAGGQDRAAASCGVASAGAMAMGISETEWHSLGVTHPAQALARVREWVSAVCRRVVDEVEQCDAWFAAQQLSAFDCSHSLQELLTVTPPPPSLPVSTSGLFGSTAAAPPLQPAAGGFASVRPVNTTVGLFAPPPSSTMTFTSGGGGAAPLQQTMTRREALGREKELVYAQQRNVRDFDTILRYEQRLALEDRLDLRRTFPCSDEPATAGVDAAAAATLRQQYVLHRLRALAKQRSFASCRDGSSTSSRRGSSSSRSAARHAYDTFPCDIHIVLHILRTCVPGLEHVIRFRHQLSTTAAHDIAIVVGDTGEPYCYVRYRSHHSSRNVTPRPGGDSLFEALLAFAALVRAHHHDVYTTAHGVVDLRRANMTRFFA